MARTGPDQVRPKVRVSEPVVRGQDLDDDDRKIGQEGATGEVNGNDPWPDREMMDSVAVKRVEGRFRRGVPCVPSGKEGRKPDQVQEEAGGSAFPEEVPLMDRESGLQGDRFAP